MRILGLDPGSRVCGYGVIDDRAGTLRYVECGILTAPEDRPMEQRLGEIARALTEVVNELRPNVVAVEDVFTHHNPRSALALAQARGMVLAVIGLAGIPVSSYPPASVKKAVSGSGRAEKDQIARMVQALIGLRTLPRADATDALAVAITHGRSMQPTAVRLTSAVVRARSSSPDRPARSMAAASMGGVSDEARLLVKSPSIGRIGGPRSSGREPIESGVRARSSGSEPTEGKSRTKGRP